MNDNHPVYDTPDLVPSSIPGVALGRFELEQRQSVFDYLRGLNEKLCSEQSVLTMHCIVSPKGLRLILKAKASARKQERWKKIHRRQKRAAFRRWKRGLA